MDILTNYIYLYHLNKFCVLPTMPESISDTMSSSFNATNALSRSAPIQSYNNSGPRQVSFNFDLHRDIMEDLNTDVSNLKDNVVDIGDKDYVDLLLNYLQACALPKYNIYKSGSKAVEPPQVAVRMGNDIFIRGDTYENWKANNPILGINEIVYDQTHRAIKIGDGVHSFLNLPYIGFDDFDFDFDFGDLDENPNDSSHDVDFNELNRGKDGKSAYEIWLEEGSVQDFLDSLIGADGKSAFEVWRDDYMHDPTLTIDDYVEYMTTTSWSDMDDL